MSGIRLSSTILTRKLLMPSAGYHYIRTYTSDASGAHKDPERVAAGLKAALHNPATSHDAKDKARQRLHEMGFIEKDPERVAAGLKAALHNPATSTDAKKHAREHLVDMGYEFNESGISDKPQGSHHHASGESHSKAGHSQAEEDEHRKMGGYKATLKNPHVSQQAKDHAMKELKEHGAI